MLNVVNGPTCGFSVTPRAGVTDHRGVSAAGAKAPCASTGRALSVTPGNHGARRQTEFDMSGSGVLLSRRRGRQNGQDQHRNRHSREQSDRAERNSHRVDHILLGISRIRKNGDPMRLTVTTAPLTDADRASPLAGSGRRSYPARPANIPGHLRFQILSNRALLRGYRKTAKKSLADEGSFEPDHIHLN